MIALTEASSWSDLALGALVTWGPLALALALLLCGTGLPVPGTIVLVAAGAFARQGMMVWYWAYAAALVGVVIGDHIAYAVGWLGGGWVEERFGASAAWQSALDQLNQRAAWTIFLTRWLITPIGAVVAMIAGIRRYPLHRFTALAVTGEFIWVTLYWTIGWVLGSQWQAAATLLTDFSGLILGVSLLLIAAVLGIRALLRSRRTVALGGEDELDEGIDALQPAEAVSAGDFSA